MKILLSGCTGNMGKVINELCNDSKKYQIVAGFADRSNFDGAYPIYDDILKSKEQVDVVIDFSYKDTLGSILEYGLSRKTPLVIASTGFDKEDEEKIISASKEIPILYSGNMSLGINTLLNVVEQLSKTLSEFDIEIVEKHHNLKKDSPSGTAKMLYNAVNKGRENTLNECYGREGTGLSRDGKEVGIHAIRGGTIVGEHTIIFAGIDEVVEVTHRASSKKIFAKGALKGSEYIVSKKNGLYDMQEILK